MTRTASRSAVSLTLSSLLWTILLPGVVSGYVPWAYFGVRDTSVNLASRLQLLGLLLILAGAALLVACIVEFARSGRGTLSPVDPPTHLVVRGLYRYVRNPMYLSVTAILLGEVMLTRSGALALYWLIWFVVVNAFVIGYEEPTLRVQFGESYDEYVRTVGRVDSQGRAEITSAGCAATSRYWRISSRRRQTRKSAPRPCSSCGS